jgi:hypothetical protein
VPKFYLRYFSHAGKGKLISLWNGPRQLYIREARLSDQAYENNFYGADGVIEDGLALLESRVAEILARIMSTHSLPTIGSEEQTLLYTFVMFQAERTKAGAIDMEDTADQMMRRVFREDPRFKPYLPSIKLKLMNPGAQKLALVAPLVPLILDLKAKLLINESPHEFITSDNPVMRYNQFMEARAWPGSGAGWSLPGLQVIFPLSPKLCLILYDNDMYTFKGNHPDMQKIEGLSDINYLNGLQYLLAEENVYFSDHIDQLYARRMHRRWAHRRQPRVVIDEYKQRESMDDKERKGSIIVSTHNNIRIGMELSFLRFATDPEKRSLGPSMWNPRNAYVEKVLLFLEKDRNKERAARQ